MAGSRVASVERLVLGHITAVPDWHPEFGTFEPFPVHAWVVRHAKGVVLFDTGIGNDNALIADWYQPRVTSIADALASVQLVTDDITSVVLSHLHFDHCGQQAALRAPVFVQAEEWGCAQARGYTVPDWAAIEPDRLRLIEGDREVAGGVHVIATPGHTPGHQSLVVDTQWDGAARASLARIRDLAPRAVHLSHDDRVVEESV